MKAYSESTMRRTTLRDPLRVLPTWDWAWRGSEPCSHPHPEESALLLLGDVLPLRFPTGTRVRAPERLGNGGAGSTTSYDSSSAIANDEDAFEEEERALAEGVEMISRMGGMRAVVAACGGDVVADGWGSEEVRGGLITGGWMLADHADEDGGAGGLESGIELHVVVVYVIMSYHVKCLKNSCSVLVG
ncbi:hypothetical protein CVT25_014371 [Psilocybe cyanescens]|uniref:Uncharacterized protein n=1 Tax=Psilocybe cyanescens TaxID=93625 RepID=A0A409XPC8_PSICY|nr:hypothetical protein CVT25_014371 [Psilocybe cyanescens]